MTSDFNLFVWYYQFVFILLDNLLSAVTVECTPLTSLNLDQMPWNKISNDIFESCKNKEQLHARERKIISNHIAEYMISNLKDTSRKRAAQFEA